MNTIQKTAVIHLSLIRLLPLNKSNVQNKSNQTNGTLATNLQEYKSQYLKVSDRTFKQMLSQVMRVRVITSFNR